jgi:predicted permease
MFYTVVGVMPKHFVFPYQNVQFWTPLADPKALSGTGGGSNSSRAEFLMHDSLNIYLVSARLADRVSRQQAQALLDAINARQINLEIPGLASRKGWMMRLRPMSAMFADEATREKLWTLFAGIALVWLIACANVANLLAARAEARQHEMAMRVVLGAGRARLMRQTLTECLLLALVGGVCGLLLTGWGVAALDTLLAGIRLKPLALNWPVFATAMAISAVTGIVFGLIPARRASRPKVFETLKQTGAASTQVARGRRFVGGLILGEIALAVVLLAGAGLTIRSLINILTYDFGYDAKNLIELRLTAPAAKYANDPAALQGLATRLNERLANLPGIAAIGTHATDTAGESASFSLAGGTRFRADGSADAHAVVQEFAGLDALDPFKAMGVRLIEGRPLDRSDVERRTVVVNESLARRFWPGQSALGQRLRPASAQDGDGALEVVGIVSDIRRIGGDLLPQQNAPLTLYRPIPDPWVSSALPTMYLRTTIDPVAIIPSLQQALSEVEPDLVGRRITVVSDALAMATQGRRYFMGFLIAFAAVGLTLAVIGLYGLMAFNVQRRTREFGVRMALGATGREVLLRVTGDGVKLAGLGLALGLVLAFPAMRLIQNQLYGVTSSDPLTLLVVVLVLLATAATASFIPARRAARIHPMEALRCE